MATADDTFALAWKYHQQNQFQQAEQLYRQALYVDPFHSDAWCFLGAVCKSQGKLTEAEACLRRSVQLLPTHPCAQNHLGVVLAELGKLDDAALNFQEYMRHQPHDADAHNNLGLVRIQQDRLDEAIACFRETLRMQPKFADACCNMGDCYKQLGRYDPALACCDQALTIDPDHALAHFNRSLLWLVQGDFARGWPEYEWRRTQIKHVRRTFSQPRWDGSPLEGRTILLHSEQGLGDILQCIRFAPLVKARGGHVVVECQPQLKRLLAGAAGIDGLVAEGGALPAFDVFASLLSLPGIIKADLTNIPAAVPYLHAEAEVVEKWRQELAPVSGLKVGIVWQGSTVHRNDKERSVPLAQFAPLAKLDGVTLISLQVGYGREQLAETQFPVVDLGNRFDPTSFADAAAAIMNLDLVVTVDTAVAHLAGALGVTVWVAVPMVPDWRWLLQREDSPWYPTLRLFRQERAGDWNTVFERLAVMLSSRVRRR